MKLVQFLNLSNVKLCPEQENAQRFEDIEVNNVTLDSRKVERGTLFVAARGATSDSKQGDAYIAQAIERGACGIVVESLQQAPKSQNIPIFICENGRQFIAVAAEMLHGSPSQEISVCGITGTNGKTTSSYFLASLLQASQKKAAIFGTLGVGSLDAPKSTGFTTPEAEVISASLGELRDEGYSHVAMEVSSHALELFRCDGIYFSCAAFLNLTAEHLDFHPNMEAYRAAKERLFLDLLPKSSLAVVPKDDALEAKVRERGNPVLTFGASEKADIQVMEPIFSPEGICVRLRLGSDIRMVNIPVFGEHNLQNVMVAAGLAMAQNVSTDVIFEAVSNLQAPPGRFEKVSLGQEAAPAVFIDFAHTPDALTNALATGRTFVKRSLKLVFGCGGQRDKQKRPVMGKIASELADEVWISNDNPRNEDENLIAQDIYQGIEESERHKTRIVLDRKQAINEAISLAKEGDVIIIAGKGHETTQQVGSEILPFSDRLVAMAALGDWKK